MRVEIRPVIADDANAIATIIQLALGDETNGTHIENVIGKDDHATFVALIDEQVIGFVDGFVTLAQNGTRRWELDLLGVHPDFQGQGVGKKLIEAFTDAGKLREVLLVRALVAIDNTAMQTAMTKTAYQKQAGDFALYVSSGYAGELDLPSDAHLIAVTTLTYTGIWLEGQLSPDTIKAANSLRAKNAWSIVGAVVLTTDETALETLQVAEFHRIGQFNWWSQPYDE